MLHLCFIFSLLRLWLFRHCVHEFRVISPMKKERHIYKIPRNQCLFYLLKGKSNTSSTKPHLLTPIVNSALGREKTKPKELRLFGHAMWNWYLLFPLLLVLPVSLQRREFSWRCRPTMPSGITDSGKYFNWVIWMNNKLQDHNFLSQNQIEKWRCKSIVSLL